MNEKMYEKNREAWNQALEYHQKAKKEKLLESFKQPDFSVYGGAYHGEVLTNKINDIGLQGKRIAHIQCHNGRELISITNSQVKQAVGFDISDVAIEDAKEFAFVANKEIDFVRTNILEIDSKYYNYFDFVFISEGALQWFQDLDEYMCVVSKLLKKGGNLLISELHPFYYLFENKKADEKVISSNLISYFEKEANNYSDGLDYMGGEVYDSKEMFWFVHKVSDIINSTIKNNIELISFDEYNLCNDYLDEELNSKLPTRYLMVGVKR